MRRISNRKEVDSLQQRGGQVTEKKVDWIQIGVGPILQKKRWTGYRNETARLK
jgi:hypothetical protein